MFGCRHLRDPRSLRVGEIASEDGQSVSNVQGKHIALIK